ncbi:hypothetical protein [Variovorax soli]|uniref:Uncharacterized protein n=1 Tax=Variovorax soli TaxID=376815 RepID=A0ABU1NEU5_9BURK|nr:hypothetical protein [Variovorax soli]MDR6536931.1 hypothetical protein [Variovorax soli]
MNTPNLSEIKTTIAQARRVADQARQMLRDADRFFAEQGFDEETCLRELRRLGGENAVRKVQADIEKTLRSIEDEIQRNSALAKSSPIARRVAFRRNRL